MRDLIILVRFRVRFLADRLHGFFRRIVDLSGFLVICWVCGRFLFYSLFCLGLVDVPVSRRCFVVPFGVPVGVGGIVGTMGFPVVRCLGVVGGRTICL